MVRIGVLGAGGVIGRMVVEAAVAAGARVVAAGRDPDAVTEALRGAGAVEGSGAEAGDVPAAVEVRGVDAGDVPAVEGLCDEVDVVVAAVPTPGVGMVEAAVRAGCHYVDANLSQAHVAAVMDRCDEPARAAGVTVVAGAGLLYTMGDLLASRALVDVPGPREVHVSYEFDGPGRPLLPSSATTRAAVADLIVAAGGEHRADGVRAERPGERRRLAWFPRPLGLRHAAGIPGAEALWVPGHSPDVGTVRTYLALRSPATEALQAAGAAVRWEPARRLVRRMLVAGPAEPDPDDRAQTRWACVAEAATATGEGGRPPADVVRAWASGRDPYRTAAGIMAWLAGAAAGGRLAAGAVSPARALDATSVLDALSDAVSLHWSVR